MSILRIAKEKKVVTAGFALELAAAQINGIPTNVSAELPDSATPEDIVRIVVRP